EVTGLQALEPAEDDRTDQHLLPLRGSGGRLDLYRDARRGRRLDRIVLHLGGAALDSIERALRGRLLGNGDAEGGEGPADHLWEHWSGSPWAPAVASHSFPIRQRRGKLTTCANPRATLWGAEAGSGKRFCYGRSAQISPHRARIRLSPGHGPGAGRELDDQ